MSNTEFLGETSKVQESGQTADAGKRLADATVNVNVAKLYGVATAFYEGIMSYDPNGSNGKGRFKGGAELYRIMCDSVSETGRDIPAEYEGQISKLARVLVDYGRNLLDLATPEVRWQGCVEFINVHRDPLALYSKGKGSKGPASLSQMVANLLSWAQKNGVDPDQVLAEVSAQVLEGGEVSE